MGDDNRKRNAAARDEALLAAGQELGINSYDAEDEALELVLNRASELLKEWGIPVPKGWQNGAGT